MVSVYRTELLSFSWHKKRDIQLTKPSVLDAGGEDALHNYFQSGGNYVGVHSASACLQNSAMYNQTVGGEYGFFTTDDMNKDRVDK